MKKLIVLLLVAAMCFSLVACGGDAINETKEQSANKAENESTVVTVENWENYLEFVVKINEDEGFLDYQIYLKAKEGIVISNEINTMVHFSYDMSKQHYTMENSKVILGECEVIEDTYTVSFAMFRNQKEEEYCEEIDSIRGSSWSFEDGNRWTIIPSNFVITEIEGTIVAE